MRPLLLSLLFLWLVAFCLALDLEPRYRLALSPSGRPANALAILLGDSRELFARHLYAKADAYFHSGYYPTIFDHQSDQLHLSDSPNRAGEHSESEGSWLGDPKDWLDRFSRHFYPTEHRHLGEGGHHDHDEHDHGNHEEHGHHDHRGHDNHDHDGDGHPDHAAHEHDAHGHGDHADEHAEHSSAPTKEDRELLPWLSLSATLNPEQPQTYVVASYWLRSQLGKVREAEQFLREGLRHNPGHPELLFELGRIHRENHQDTERARNIWEVALKKWQERSAEEQEKNRLLSAQLLVNLAQLEEETGRYPEAINYLRTLTTFSPNKEHIEQWIAELEQRKQ